MSVNKIQDYVNVVQLVYTHCDLDWIIHNLIFLLIFGPFIVYFGYAWYKVLISPCVFDVELETIDNTADKSKPDISELLETLTDGIAKKLKEKLKKVVKKLRGLWKKP